MRRPMLIVSILLVTAILVLAVLLGRRSDGGFSGVQPADPETAELPEMNGQSFQLGEHTVYYHLPGKAESENFAGDFTSPPGALVKQAENGNAIDYDTQQYRYLIIDSIEKDGIVEKDFFENADFYGQLKDSYGYSSSTIVLRINNNFYFPYASCSFVYDETGETGTYRYCELIILPAEIDDDVFVGAFDLHTSMGSM